MGSGIILVWTMVDRGDYGGVWDHFGMDLGPCVLVLDRVDCGGVWDHFGMERVF